MHEDGRGSVQHSGKGTATPFDLQMSVLPAVVSDLHKIGRSRMDIGQRSCLVMVVVHPEIVQKRLCLFLGEVYGFSSLKGVHDSFP